MDLSGMDIFLGYKWLIKHNQEVNWSIGTMQFTRCLKTYRTRYQDILFIPKYQRIQVIDEKDNRQQEIEKEPGPTNPEDLSDYIQPFMHLFNKKKFKKLPERQEWDYKINLMDEAPRELNTKAYVMTIKEEEVLNQWLDEQLKA